MVIGLATVECLIYEAHSLKDKRAVLKKIMTRLKNKFNLSVAEVDYQDVWQRTKIAIVVVTSVKQMTEREINGALKLIDSFPEIERTITEIEWL